MKKIYSHLIIIGIALLLPASAFASAGATLSISSLASAGALASDGALVPEPTFAGASAPASVSEAALAGDYFPCAHPRLLLNDNEEAKMVEALSKDNGPLKEVNGIIMDFCNQTLDKPAVERIKTGKRLLSVSREALKRIFYLSYAYRVTGDKAYSGRCIKEMMAVCAFTDWNPSHFLDVAEMTMGVAIGYDWLYDELSDEQKSVVRNAIVTKAFIPSENRKYAWFYKSDNNWNQVCNAGLVYGALAIYEDETQAADSVIARCRASISLPMNNYSPEGGYAEGYGYWGYGTGFQIMLEAGLESALGTDLDISGINGGFLNSSSFIRMMTTPSGHCFNFSDSGTKAEFQYTQVWLAKKRGDLSVLNPQMAIFRKNGARALSEERLLPFFIIYGYDVDFSSIPVPTVNHYYCGGENPLFIYRSGWESDKDTYLGVKGGKAANSHGHVDCGSFLFESDGVLWAEDLGMQSYFTLESKGVDLWNMMQDSERWNVFRIGFQSHNILSFDGHRPDVNAFCPIVRTSGKCAVVNLSRFYASDLDSCEREVSLNRKNDLVIRDFISNDGTPDTLRWAMCTSAKARIVDSRTIELSKDGHVRRLTVVDKNARSMVWPASSENSYDLPNPGSVMVGFERGLDAGEKVTLIVKLQKIK